jgi:predicted transcriptional regulator
MKTAVSIPDPVFRAAERLAKRMRKTRSGLYAEALREYVARHDPDEIARSWSAVAHLLDTPEMKAWRHASYGVLRRIEW